MPVDGNPKFNTLTLGEFTVDFRSGGTHLKAKAAFVDRQTGATHGWTEGFGSAWSKDTIAKLLELRESMEQDLARVHFSDHTPVALGSSQTIPVPGGISEHLREEVEQV